jgi:predicted ester cyclase
MLTADNRDTVRLYWDEFINRKNLALAERILAPGFLLHDPLSPAPVGRDVFVGMLTELFGSFPDIQYKSEEEFAEASKLVIRWSMSATHRGSFIGIAPTGKKVSMSGVDMLYLSGGKIETLRIEANLLGLAHQLGAVPALDLSC